jgi:hypothetical protein
MSEHKLNEKYNCSNNITPSKSNKSYFKKVQFLFPV